MFLSLLKPAESEAEAAELEASELEAEAVPLPEAPQRRKSPRVRRRERGGTRREKSFRLER